MQFIKLPWKQISTSLKGVHKGFWEASAGVFQYHIHKNSDNTFVANRITHYGAENVNVKILSLKEAKKQSQDHFERYLRNYIKN